jgi:hypothetical protein
LAANRGKSWHRVNFDYCFTTIGTVYGIECVFIIQYIACRKNVNYNVLMLRQEGAAEIGSITESANQLHIFLPGLSAASKEQHKSK